MKCRHLARYPIPRIWTSCQVLFQMFTRSFSLMELSTSINEVFHSIKHEYQLRAIDTALLNETITLRDAQPHP